ncbi:unnamed protein product [Urochloa decumbens]|uniref:Uncharacterized protein n=1 Tax=Urochloa decumbens TaxID=240449 RepID=A0ABC9GD27_9POAL
MAPPLLEELVEECLLRFPPDEPASLVRAALVASSASSGSASSPTAAAAAADSAAGSFFAGSSFVPTSPSFRPPNADRHGLRAVHSGHGRVLLHGLHHTGDDAARPDQLVVWDPITDEQRELPFGPMPFPLSWDAAVLCAAGDHGCNHLGCHRGPFLVVFLGAELDKIFSCVYSSEADMWSEPIYTQGSCNFELGNSLLLGSALYFKLSKRSYFRRFLLKYDLLTQEMSEIHLPAQGAQQHIVLMPTEDGRLGFVRAHWSSVHKHILWLWSRKDGPNEGAIWACDSVFFLHWLKDDVASKVQVSGFAGNGARGVVFFDTGDGFFTIDLNSRKSKRVGESTGFSPIVVPYVSFCTPALQAASAAVGPSPSASSA